MHMHRIDLNLLIWGKIKFKLLNLTGLLMKEYKLNVDIYLNLQLSQVVWSESKNCIQWEIITTVKIYEVKKM